MSKDQSESSSFKKREKIKTVREVLEVADSVVTKTFKIALSNLFKRERSKLKPFLLQVEMNIQFNESQFKSKADKVLYITIYLQDHTVKWFQPVLINYLKHKVKNQNNNTIKMFVLFKLFKN